MKGSQALCFTSATWGCPARPPGGQRPPPRRHPRRRWRTRPPTSGGTPRRPRKSPPLWSCSPRRHCRSSPRPPACHGRPVRRRGGRQLTAGHRRSRRRSPALRRARSIRRPRHPVRKRWPSLQPTVPWASPHLEAPTAVPAVGAPRRARPSGGSRPDAHAEPPARTRHGALRRGRRPRLPSPAHRRRLSRGTRRRRARAAPMHCQQLLPHEGRLAT
mmetsp:Transcript_42032/g.133545  ORF Transcript_42032/g.133545 Transcript_42032/m.133545 type:complete len:216 (-) Transcript_42032:367-1014(-)